MVLQEEPVYFDDNKKAAAQILCKARHIGKKKLMSQEEVADRLDVARQMVTRYEDGDLPWGENNRDRLLDIAKAYRLSPEETFDVLRLLGVETLPTEEERQQLNMELSIRCRGQAELVQSDDILTRLRPLDFSSEISRRTRKFTGRQWLLDAVGEWMENDSSRVFFITGEPGIGKSAVMATLTCTFSRRIGAHHFCVDGLQDSLNPTRFVHSLAAQLARHLTGYRNALATVDFDALPQDDPSSLFRRLIVDPCNKKPPEQVAVILIDALDEALIFGDANIAKVVRDRMRELPEEVRFILSSRSHSEIIDMFSEFNPREICSEDTQNKKDVLDYLEQRLCAPELLAIVNGFGLDISSAAKLIAQKGEGNFLYITNVVTAIEAQQLDLRNPEAFPQRLVGIYNSFFERLFPRGTGYESLRLIITVIESAREPLTAEQIANFVEADVYQVTAQLDSVAPFFPEKDGYYEVYHKSLSDWLRGKVGQSRAYRIDLRAGHRCIAEKLLVQYKSGQWNVFMVTHLPAHLAELQQQENLQQVLTDPELFQFAWEHNLNYETWQYSKYLDALQSMVESTSNQEAL